MNPVIARFLEKTDYPAFEPKAVFFDMDGVLFDSMPYHAEAWTRVMRENGLDFNEYDAYMNEGRTGDTTIDEFYIKQYGHQATPDEKKRIYAAKSDYFNAFPAVKPIAGVKPLLAMVKAEGLQRFVVTGSAQASLIDNLELHFPAIFEAGKTVTAFDVKYGKPDPEPYLIALNKSGVRPWEAVVVENAPLGVRSAKAAGIFTIAVNTGILRPEELEKEGADIVLPDMEALISFWPQLFAK